MRYEWGVKCGGRSNLQTDAMKRKGERFAHTAPQAALEAADHIGQVQVRTAAASGAGFGGRLLMLVHGVPGDAPRRIQFGSA
ncbi:hypothetical protein OKW30_007410 [Paraburkholderia sp. Clong3]|nr:hypothetical protein [Paraburkholderia sp. CI2]